MSNRTVLITGVSKGIGQKLVLQFLDAGFTVVGLSRTECRNSHFASNVNYHHIVYSAEQIDVLFGALQSLISDIGEIRYLINNAGLLINKPAIELTSLDFQSSFQINSLFPFLLVQGMLNRSLFFQNAHIVNVSSVGGVQGAKKFSGLLAYSASKAALIAISECMQEEWGDKLTINALALGSVDTEMFQEAFFGAKASLSDVDTARWIFNFTVESVNIIAGQVIQVKKIDPTR